MNQAQNRPANYNQNLGDISLLYTQVSSQALSGSGGSLAPQDLELSQMGCVTALASSQAGSRHPALPQRGPRAPAGCGHCSPWAAGNGSGH